MSENHNFALMPRPPGALERAEPGAKRILSGMVADTLALAKKAPGSKRVFSVATCGELTTEALQILISSPLQKILGNSYAVELSAFEYTDDLLTTVSNFDLIFVLRWPYSPLISPNKGKPEPHKLIAELRAKFGKPVIVIGLELWCRQIAGADPGWQESGADAYFEVDFSTESFVVPAAFNRALKNCVAKSLASRASVEAVVPSRRGRPLRIVILDDEPLIASSIRMVMQKWFKDATILTFTHGDEALEELEREDPDLFTTDWSHPGRRCDEMLRLLATRKAKYPIFVISSYAQFIKIKEWFNELSDLGLNATLVEKPFTPEELRQLLLKNLGASYHPPLMAEKDTQ